MREPGGKLDSLHPTDATHLQPASQPKERTSDARDAVVEEAPTDPTATDFYTQHASVADTESTASVRAYSSTATTSTSSLSPVLRDRILIWLRKHVPNSRLQHILRVEAMSVALANQHGIDPNQAAQAGLMHDLAKFFKPQRLLHMAHADGWAIDPVEAANPHLLHATVGAIVARDEFGIHDDAVLDAIRQHTLGSPEMRPLSCVVFLADSLEPGRGDTPALVALRQLSQQNLYRAVWQTCDESLHQLILRAQSIHPRMVLTRNWALSLSQSKPSGSHSH